MSKARWTLAAIVLAAGLVAPATQASAVIVCGDGLGPPSTAEPSMSVPSRYATADYIDAEAERAEAWTDYQQSVVETLSRSADPRDWALAAVGSHIPYSNTSGRLRDQLANGLARAAAAAQDDALVQWLAMSQSTGAASKREAQRRLEQHETGNAALWLADLDDGVRVGDKSAVNAALARMAASEKFDAHFSDLVQALAQAYRRVPAPDSLFDALPDDDRARLRDVLPLTAAMAQANAIAIPGFQNLLNACRVDPATGVNIERAGDCAAIGRMLVARGDTLIANRIGSSLLRVARVFSAGDVEAARVVDWISTSYAPLANEPPMAHPVERMQRYVDDWIETGRELEAMRRALEREGVVSAPAPDWRGPYPSFSEERLRADARFFEQRAAN